MRWLVPILIGILIGYMMRNTLGTLPGVSALPSF